MNMQDGAVLGNRLLAHQQNYFDNFFNCGYVMTGCSGCPKTSNETGEQLLYSINVTMDFELQVQTLSLCIKLWSHLNSCCINFLP